MSKKLTIEFISEQFAKEGYTLLSENYINNKQKLDYICPNGHKHYIRWDMWKIGQRCPYCVGQCKLTIDFIRNELTKEGYTLLSKKYFNNKTKFDYICPNGHKHNISWSDWSNGFRCPYCSGNVKLTIEFIREEFAKEGYILLSKKYINNRTKLKYQCPKGHKHDTSWNNWQQGRRCPYCSGKIKLTIDLVKKEFEREGYILISKEYINNHTKLRYECPNGHKHSTTWASWIIGNRCPYCAGNKRLTIDFVKNEFESEGYTLLSTKYKNNYTKLDYICPKGHRHSISWVDWKKNARCPYCYGNKKLTIDFVRKEFEKEGYTLLSKKYINSCTKLKYICPNGHEHAIRWAGWTIGNRCPICANIKMSGPGHPNWQGGKSFEPYCEAWKDQEYKADIRKRDGNKCLNPYCRSKNSNDLTIHHIDFNKKNCHPSNLITVCRSCNSAANKNRNWHMGWYQAIMNKRYGYIY